MIRLFLNLPLLKRSAISKITVCETNSINILTSEKKLIQEIINQIQDPDLKQKFTYLIEPEEEKPPQTNYNLKDVFDRFKKPNRLSSNHDLCGEVNQMKGQISQLEKQLYDLKVEVSIIKDYSPSVDKAKAKLSESSSSSNSSSGGERTIQNSPFSNPNSP
ncbi:hypothetical protein Adt_21026 [Abeliophyllum distichum]|uniref:Uncharacterized protein n=1 Tax=Abeliophyllum distichum TaxID=126358 RepID=A0ABD1SY60_9LAMI